MEEGGSASTIEFRPPLTARVLSVVILLSGCGLVVWWLADDLDAGLAGS